MGRPSTIETHRERERIITDLSNGKTLAEISRRYGLSEASLSRYRLSRNIAAVEDLDEDPYSSASIVERMRALIEDARQLRTMAAYTSPGVRSRLIDSEARLLAQFRDYLGVDAVAVADQVEAGQALARAVSRFVKTDPESAHPLVQQLQADDTLSDLGHALAARMPAITTTEASR